MKNLLFTLLLLASVISTNAQIVSTKYFFKAREIETLESASLSEKFDLKPIAQIPAIKITESTRDNTQLDATFLVSAGGGITFQRIGTKINENGEKENFSPWSFSPLTILLSGNTAEEGAILDISWCSTVGFYNNLFQVGIGYDFGEVTERSRWFAVLTIGINLTNN